MMMNIMKPLIGQRTMLLLLLLSSTAKAFLPMKNPVRALALVRTLSSTTATATSSSSMLTQSPSHLLADKSTAYAHVLQKLQQITHLNQAKALLSYDQLVFMPKAASAARGAQMSALASVIHELTTSPELKQAIDQAMVDAVGSQDADAKLLLQLERKALMEQERIPTTLAAHVASLGASAYSHWVECKEANDYEAFCSTLQECFDTSMQVADKKAANARIPCTPKCWMNLKWACLNNA
jgi:hypothetical protein